MQSKRYNTKDNNGLKLSVSSVEALLNVNGVEWIGRRAAVGLWRLRPLHWRQWRESIKETPFIWTPTPPPFEREVRFSWDTSTVQN